MSESPSAKSIAIIAYITFIGTLIAYFMNREPKHTFATKHIQNMFGLLLVLFCAQVAYRYMNPIIGDTLWIAAFIAWAFSLVTAIIGKKPSIPFLSNKFEEWFQFLK
ncbi:hypothetical protein BTO09_13070 [Gilvibacter sp. SZ-19]|uniref:hypothetical protein n=1 Tax=Gilvibacter sp. SZ-19 TaxID=754429 RepID=UPI000B3D3477|nr:hypothetical protein [Gilvibacter sp. SZ-19]ARV13216.1 hypothetical protein BTO09_13070 [Gilvibacter sp. SZ-19]